MKSYISFLHTARNIKYDSFFYREMAEWSYIYLFEHLANSKSIQWLDLGIIDYLVDILL